MVRTLRTRPVFRPLLVAILAITFGGCGGPKAPTDPSKQIPSPQPPTTPAPTDPVPPAPNPDDFPPPTARLAITIDSLNSPTAIETLSRIHFDASASTGEGLSYLIDFGDGGRATVSSIYHPVSLNHEWGKHTLGATLTVTDRFGRTDSVRRPYNVMAIHDNEGVGPGVPGQYPILFWIGWSSDGCINVRITRVHQAGLALTADVYMQRSQSPACASGPTRSDAEATGALWNERDIDLVRTDGVRLAGVLQSASGTDGNLQMLLDVIGGPYAGRHLTLVMGDSP